MTFRKRFSANSAGKLVPRLLDWINAPRAENGIRFSAGRDWERLSYDELTARVFAVANGLLSRGVKAGDRISIVAPNGQRFVESFFGILAAGASVVPLPPMLSIAEAGSYESRLTHMLSIATPRGILVDPMFEHMVTQACARVDTDAFVVDPHELVDTTSFTTGPGPDLALIQFTSGSSGNPKALHVSMSALEANLSAITHWLNMDHSSSTATWLPTSHDMGLIGTLLTPIFNQADLSIMRPDEFIASPLRWLKCFGEEGANITSAPNFGYAYTARRVSPKDLDGLDFSHWRVAIIGAERVQAQSLKKFADLLSGHGFSPEAFRPAYGLAESTLAVTGRSPDDPLALVDVNPDYGNLGSQILIRRESEFGQAPDLENSWLFGCGRPLEGTQVAIIDADGKELAPGHIGEIVVSGSSLATGYRTEESMTPLAGQFPTGDAGFLWNEQLYVIGRLGDCLKVNARVVYAEDVESAIRQTEALRAGYFAVVLGSTAERERVIVIVEGRESDWVDPVLRSVRQATGDAVAIDILVGNRGTLKRTSSGKPKRRLLWQLANTGKLEANRITTWTPTNTA